MTLFLDPAGTELLSSCGKCSSKILCEKRCIFSLITSMQLSHTVLCWGCAAEPQWLTGQNLFFPWLVTYCTFTPAQVFSCTSLHGLNTLLKGLIIVAKGFTYFLTTWSWIWSGCRNAANWCKANCRYFMPRCRFITYLKAYNTSITAFIFGMQTQFIFVHIRVRVYQM